MLAFTIHEPPDPPADRIDRGEALRFVRDGIAWAAIPLGPLWLLMNRLWLALLIYVAVAVGLHIALAALGAPQALIAVAGAALNVLLALEASSLMRWTLERRGWRLVGSVVGRSTLDCERRFFDAWLPGEPAIAASGLSRSTVEATGLLPMRPAAGSGEVAAAIGEGPGPTRKRGWLDALTGGKA